MSVKSKLKGLLKSENRFVRKTAMIGYDCIRNSKILYAKEYKPLMNDRKYIEMVYKKRFGVMPDLDNPKNFNEKNNWRKLYDRRDIYTSMVDKYRIKDVVRERCGEGYAFPLLGVWNKPKEIDFSQLPDKFVLKVNHAGGVIVCRDKSTFDTESALRDLKSDLKIDYFHMSREWPYKNVKRRIIAEKYMGENLTDYKNYCFNGKLAYTLVWKNESREDGRKPDAFFCGAYDRDWNRTDFRIDYPTKDELVERPVCYDELVTVVEKMSAGIPFVRVDCYIIGGRVYVGEMTFFPWGGFQKFCDESWNLRLGEMQKLPEEKHTNG